MNPTDELNLLGYTSSAADFDLTVELDMPTPQDEADLPALVLAQKLIRNRQEYYESVASLDLADEVFSVEQQLAINKKMVFHLQELDSQLDRAITKVKEKLNGRA